MNMKTQTKMRKLTSIILSLALTTVLAENWKNIWPPLPTKPPAPDNKKLAFDMFAEAAGGIADPIALGYSNAILSMCITTNAPWSNWVGYKATGIQIGINKDLCSIVSVTYTSTAPIRFQRFSCGLEQPGDAVITNTLNPGCWLWFGPIYSNTYDTVLVEVPWWGMANGPSLPSVNLYRFELQ